MSYHYPTKQELFNDVIDYYILHKQNANNKTQGAFNLSLLEFIHFYVDKVASTKNEMQQFLMRPYKTENFYALLSARKEAQPIAKQQKGRKARRQKA